MNSIKVQQDILKALITEPQTIRHMPLESDPNFTVIFHRGYVGYILPTKEIKVRLPKDSTTNLSLKLTELIDPRNELEQTEIHAKDEHVLRYTYKHDPEQWTYIDTKLLKHFKNPKLYQALHRKLTVIAIVEGETLVGAVMPTKERE